jgi:uncharacterized protein YjbJ (UPF0337 family)/ElaB/YqjD/DUF883 family membrane-anchored ribosome-binding protein
MDENRVEGTARNVGGKVQEGFGKVTGNAHTQGEGLANQAAGAAQDLYGQAADAATGFEKILRRTIETQPYTSAIVALGIGWLLGRMHRPIWAAPLEGTAMPLLSRNTRVISSDIGDIERRLRILQNGIDKLGARTSANARDTADGLGETVALALTSWADRFRQGSLGEKSAAFGKDAARYGTAALSQISKETEQRPLVAVAVALGIGILIGMAASGRSR